MTKSQRDRIRKLVDQADDLSGRASLHDYCDNLQLIEWLDEAKRLRDKAERLRKRYRRKP